MRYALLIAPFALILAGCGEGPSTAQSEAVPGNAPAVAAEPQQPAAGQTTAEPALTQRPSPTVRPVQLLAGTPLHVRLVQSLSTDHNEEGDTFQATLTAPVTRNGSVVIPRGATFHGRITGAKPSGRLTERGFMNLTLESFELGGQRYPIETSVESRVTADHKKRNITAIGGGSGVGAVVGGIVGGGKGAAIGAASGAAAGTAGAALTGKMDVEIPSESILKFTLNAPVTIISPRS
jgi:hypothetical protein